MTRTHMTYRVVALDSVEAREAPTGADSAQSAKMLAELSAAAWLASGRELPSYSRSQIPFRITTLDGKDLPTTR